MAGERRDRHVLGHEGEERGRLARGAHADRVAQRDLVRARREQRRGDLRHRARVHVAFVRAAEHARDVAAHANALRLRRDEDRLRPLEALGDSAVDVLPRKRLRGGDEHGDLVRSRRSCRFEALHVGCQHGVTHTRSAADPCHDVGGIRHLRHPLRRNEGRRLDRREAGVGEPVDQRDLDVGGHHRLFVLQSVARSDLDEADRRREPGGERHDGLRFGINNPGHGRQCRSRIPRARAGGSCRPPGGRRPRPASRPTHAASA